MMKSTNLQLLFIHVRENSYPGEILNEDNLVDFWSSAQHRAINDGQWKQRVENILRSWDRDGLIERVGDDMFVLRDF